MKAVIIAVGDELTSGRVVDTNGAYLAEQLGCFGIEVCEHRTLGDNRDEIASAIRAAAKSAQVILLSGGLGPTADDVTRHGLADATESELVIDPQCMADIEDFFHHRGRKMADANRVQAMIPSGAQPLHNSVGTAPGLAAKVGDAIVFAMPGVPHEMKRMFAEQVASRLPKGRGVMLTKKIHTFGMGESDLSGVIGDLVAQPEDIAIGTTVSEGLVTIGITTRAADTAACLRRISPISAEMRRRLGNLVVGEDSQTMASVVGSLLGRAGQTLATAESCTGGLVGKMITSVSGASEYYLGGIVAYSNEVKRDVLGVSDGILAEHGAVSEQAAAAMACGCRRGHGSDWALSLTGIAGPTGESPEKPVGLVYVGVCGPDGTEVHRHIFPGDRGHIRRRAAMAALNYLRLSLM